MWKIIISFLVLVISLPYSAFGTESNQNCGLKQLSYDPGIHKLKDDDEFLWTSAAYKTIPGNRSILEKGETFNGFMYECDNEFCTNGTIQQMPANHYFKGELVKEQKCYKCILGTLNDRWKPYDCPNKNTTSTQTATTAPDAPKQTQPAQTPASTPTPQQQTSVEKCQADRDTGEGKACCLVPTTTAKWVNNSCTCTNGGQFVYEDLQKPYCTKPTNQTGTDTQQTSSGQETTPAAENTPPDDTTEEAETSLATPEQEGAQEVENEEPPQNQTNDTQPQKQNADQAHENENSLANSMLGGASMAAMGIGGMELAQGLAQQRADAKADADMAEYLATFKCEYGPNHADGNTTGNEVPGANQLFKLYQEYEALAAEVKSIKEALNMTPGIESQVILNNATVGLYDDVSDGKTNGTYASLYRAKMGSDVDQAKLQEMSDASKNRIVGGAVTASTGASAGIGGGVLLNQIDWNKNNSDAEDAE